VNEINLIYSDEYENEYENWEKHVMKVSKKNYQNLIGIYGKSIWHCSAFHVFPGIPPRT
jgi:hypothetical protein